MKTTTTGITRLFGYMLLAGGFLVASCTSEEQQSGGNPIDPEGESSDRREILLTLKNKLALPAATKAPIATAAENAIETLDVYVFGSDTEDGTYTYQERFAYRADDNDELPAGATVLQLAVQGAEGAETTGLLKLKRGLFVKLYCVANDTLLVDPAGDGSPVKSTDFVPLTLTTPGEAETKVATPGVPQESSFISYHTRLLTADVKGDTLACPLAMSGALTTALDLTSFENSARLQTGFQLTRLSARFDIQNVAKDSRFTLQSVSMGSGRRGSRLFPIRVYGDQPTAQPAELITYPVRTFYGDKANTGLCTGAFYSYASPQADKGYLILKGIYKVNESESKEVSYQIPFRQTSPNGQEVYLDINHNHRYTVAITAADAYHLDANITVADWADDGSIEYTPENTPGEIDIIIPPAYAGETKEDKETNTVNMSVKTGSTFDMAITTNSALIVNKVYAGGVAEQSYNWLTVSEPTITPGPTLSTSIYTYTVSLTTPYLMGHYPRATLRLTNVIDGLERLLFVEPIGAPVPIETPQPPKAPNGKSDNPNTFDPNNNLVSLYRITGSQALIKINCPDGIELESKLDWLDVSISEATGTSTTATLTLNNRDAVVEGNKGVLTFYNKKNQDLKINVTASLLDASVTPDYTNIGGDNQYVPEVSGTSPANILLAIIPNNSVTVKATSLDGVSVHIIYPDGSPEWLSFEGASAVVMKATTMICRQDLVFRPVADKLTGAQKATVMLINTIGGLDYTFTITPTMQSGSALESTTTPSTPLQSVLKNKTITLYQLPGDKAATSQMTLDVTSMGGSKLTYEAIEGGVGLTLSPTEHTANTAPYVLKPALTDGTDKAIGTLYVKNYTNLDKVESYAVTVLRSALTGETAMSLNTAKDETANVTVSSFEGFTIDPLTIDWQGGDPWFNITSAADNAAGSHVKVIATATGATGTVRPAIVTLTNKIVNGGDLKVTVTPVYAVPALSVATIPTNSYNTLTATAGSATSTVKLYRVAGSALQFKATAVGGTKLAGTPVGVTVTRNTGGNDYTTENIYTVTWDGMTITDGSFQLVNSQDASKVQTITVQLPVTTNSVPGNISLNTALNQTASTTFNTPEGFTAAVTSWGAGGSAWFTLNTADFAAGNQTITVKSTAPSNVNMQMATVTLTNKIAGGTSTTFTVTPTFGTPTMTYANGNVPVQNSMSGTTASLYNVTGSKLNVTVTSVGGVTVTSNAGVNVSANTSDNTSHTYTLTWNGSAAPGNYSVVFANKRNTDLKTTLTVTILNNAIIATNTNVTAANSGDSNIPVTSPAGCTAQVTNWNGGGQWFDITTHPSAGNSNLVITQRNNANTLMKSATITLTNSISGGTPTTVTVTPTGFSAPTLSSSSGTTAFAKNTNNRSSITFTVTPPSVGGMAEMLIRGNDVTTDNNNNNNTITVNCGNSNGAIIYFRNNSDPSKEITYTLSVDEAWYHFQNGTGYYIAMKDAGLSSWNSDLSTTYCSSRKGSNWFLPSDTQWREIIGGTSDDAYAPNELYEEYSKNQVFGSGAAYWSSSSLSNERAYMLFFYTPYMQVTYSPQSVDFSVRCVTK